jgi:phosphoribulokinase
LPVISTTLLESLRAFQALPAFALPARSSSAPSAVPRIHVTAMTAFVAPVALSARPAFGSAVSSAPARNSAFAPASAPARRVRAAPAGRALTRMVSATTDTFVAAPGSELSTHHAEARIASNVSDVMAKKGIKTPVIIGVAADSGCGKSTFLRRVLNIFGTDISDEHTPQGDFVTVICLDDFHLHDRFGRRDAGVTALDEKANNFTLMASQIAALKEGKSIMKPIYNHETGEIDPCELVQPNHLIVIEGLHPMYDSRVKDELDFTVYLDLADEVKIAWKIQRDMAERGHSLENILASIESRKPDFAQFVDPQKRDCDVVMEILPTQLIPDDDEKKVLRVRLIQAEGKTHFKPAFLYDEGSTIDWVPCGRKLTCSYPGIKFHYGPDTYFDKEVSILEVDGVFDKLEEMIYVESHLNNTGTKFYGEMTQQLLKNPNAPGSTNGTGLFQVLMAMMMRSVYESVSGKKVAVSN